MSGWTILGLVFGGALLLEGVVWALFPAATRRAYQRMMETPEGSLQIAGLVSAVLGGLLVMLALR